MIKTELIGTVTSEPIRRNFQFKTGGESHFMKFRLRVTDFYNGKEHTVFVPCDAWRQMADIAESKLHKGTKIKVTGTLRNDNYTCYDGRYVNTLLLDVNGIWPLEP